MIWFGWGGMILGVALTVFFLATAKGEDIMAGPSVMAVSIVIAAIGWAIYFGYLLVRLFL